MGRLEVLRVPHSERSEYTQGDKLLSEHWALFLQLPPSLLVISSWVTLYQQTKRRRKGRFLSHSSFQAALCYLPLHPHILGMLDTLQINSNKTLIIPWRFPLGKDIAHWRVFYWHLVSSFHFQAFRRQPNSWRWGIFHSTLWGLLGQNQNTSPEQQPHSMKRGIWCQTLVSGLRPSLTLEAAGQNRSSFGAMALCPYIVHSWFWPYMWEQKDAYGLKFHFSVHWPTLLRLP